jgi:N-alpha-acetyltransferase 30
MGTPLLHGQFTSPSPRLTAIPPRVTDEPTDCPKAVDSADGSLIGAVICKLETHSSHSPPTRRGYIAMLAVHGPYRGKGIATTLVKRAIDAMVRRDADEIVLETEETNTSAMRLYERLGFFRSKKLHRYYLNGNSAYRLVLTTRPVDPDRLVDEA